MEERIAILMADLSGYSALTETHGALSAADLIDQYLTIAETSLVGDCSIHECTGDEIMIVSPSADELLATALSLADNTSKEHLFLQVHGGLHYGEVIKRRDSYFGSTINLTARVAASASAGSFWCTANFIQALTNPTAEFISQGFHRYKNLTGEIEVFAIGREHREFFIDPVCRMLILDPARAIAHPEDPHLFYCSEGCLHIHTEGSYRIEPGKG